MVTYFFLKKIFFLTIFIFLFIFTDFNFVSTAYCIAEKVKNTSPRSFSLFNDLLTPSIVVSSTAIATRSLPTQARAITTASVTVASLVSLGIKKLIDKEIIKAEQKMDAIISSKKAAAQSVLEFKLFDNLQFEQLITLLCIFFIFFAAILFAIVVLWTINNKYPSWIVFLNKNKILAIFIAKIEKISLVKLAIFIFFIYMFLFISVYLLLTCF